MYASPIEKIYGELQTQIIQEDENMVMKAIREVGILVDKEELINALQYDRKQYTKGYSDGKSDVLDKIRAEIKEWYWQADKQALAKDPCVVDAMIDLFIRTIDKHKAESEVGE